MRPSIKNGPKSVVLPDNALAKQALENIIKIEREAQQQKLEQLESLKSAKAAILQRISELNHQLEQIDTAMSSITGEAVSSKTQRRPRRNLDELRERLVRWMEGHKGQKFMAGDLAKEFAELEGIQTSIFLKPLIEAGKIKTDATEGIRRTKYYAEG